MLKEKRLKKEKSLIAVLQLKAREVILNELEQERIKRQHEREEAKQEIDKMITQ